MTGRKRTEGGSIARFLAADHERLDALLTRAVLRPGALDVAAFDEFRAGILRHIAIEEKILFPAVREARAGSPHPDWMRLRIDHGAITSLLVPPPTPEIVAEIRSILDPHNAIEEGPGGLYEGCDQLLGAKAAALLERMRSYPPVKVAPYREGPRVLRRAEDALRLSAKQFENLTSGQLQHGPVHAPVVKESFTMDGARPSAVNRGTSMPRDRRALAIQHVAAEPPNLIAAALGAEGVVLDVARVDRGDAVPVDADGLSALVIMGGPMSVSDAGRLEHLREELRLLESALRLGVPVLGVCLGSQLLAHVLGARVAPAGFLELGWLPVSLTTEAAGDPLLGPCPQRFTALHWHGDAFDLPRGAVHLARSDRTAVQAFRHDRAWGLLFHLEADVAQVEEMARTFAGEVARGGSSEAALVQGAQREVPSSRPIGLEVFRRFAHLAAS